MQFFAENTEEIYMKKNLIAILMIMGIVLLSGCKEEEPNENNLPVITGETTVEYDEGDVEPNWLDFVTATDEEDGEIVLDLSHVNLENVDMDTPGTFEVIFTVTDLDGGTVTHTLTVTINEVIEIVYDVPNITNGSELYATIDGYEFTKDDVWEYMVNKFGLSMTLQYMEEQIFVDEIAAITEEQVLEAKNLMLFGTNDAEYIAEAMADEERYQELLNIYEEQLLFLGYNPDNTDDVRSFFSLQLAKGLYAKDFLINAGEENDFQITMDQLEAFYLELNTPPVCALPVVFNSSNEIDAVFNSFNLVPNYNYGIGEYYGVIPITDVSSDIFDETNTTQLTDDEVFSKYVLLYNYMNPSKEQLPTDLTKEDFCQNYPELALHDKNEMLENINYATHPVVLYSGLIFDTLRIDEEGYSRYSYRSTNVAGDFVFAYKVQEDDVPAFEDLTDEEITQLKVDFATEMVKSLDVVAAITRDLFTASELQIIHPIFEIQYEIQNNVDIMSYGSLVNVATYGDIEVSADDLFDYIDKRVGLNVIMSMYELEYLLHSDLYTELYGEDLDFMNSENEEVVELRTQLDSILTNFENGVYIQYGFDPTAMTLLEFLYAGFGETTLENVFLNIFLLPNLQFDYAYSNLPDSSVFTAFMEKKYDEYFSLTTEHLILYVDEDNDFTPDDFSDFLDSLTEEELVEYNALKVQFENNVADRISNGLSLQQISSEFKNGLVDDELNIWKDIKAFGFKMKHEQLGILSSDNVNSFDDGFKNSLHRLADMLYRPENDAVDEYYDDQLTTTDFGIHSIYVKKTNLFTKPTAVFSEADPLYPVYSIGSENDSILPSNDQIELYIGMVIAEMRSETTDISLPSNVVEAIEKYYVPVYDIYISNWGTSIQTLTMITEGQISFTTYPDQKALILGKQLENLQHKDDFLEVE